jgi:mannose/cellobiose epimerase-like protein (N-acyl-D-glucosamine 2-epimerase family)
VKRVAPSILLVCSSGLTLSFGYTIQCPYLEEPSLAIGYVDSCAEFWLGTYDDDYGGFYTNIDKYGNVIYSTDKYMLTQTRNAYGLTRAFMLTGNTAYLTTARAGLDFMYDHAWDGTHEGWFNEMNNVGIPLYPTSTKSAFFQHYALLGIAAYFEATRDTLDWNWLMTGFDHLEDVFWDTRPSYLGYYDESHYNGTSAWNKSFNATVDAVTTHLLYLYLLTEEEGCKDRLIELADEMMDHLVASMPEQAIGFVEKFDSDWNWNNDETMTIMGHVLKTGWCLGRICQLEYDVTYLDASETLFRDVWENGYDHEFGGPYKDYDRITGEMLMWGNPDTTKSSWQMEQAVNQGLEMFFHTGDSLYLEMADETLDFFMRFFVDHEYGEVYANRTRYGDFAWNENKGDAYKAGYHSIELGYYVYLYGNLFLQERPVTLHYQFVESPSERRIHMTPLAMADSLLCIENVIWEGQPYYAFHPDRRVLVLPPGVGGHFVVTYAPVEPTVITEDDLSLHPETIELRQNYPNPFTGSTRIAFHLPRAGDVTLEIYNVQGHLVQSRVLRERAAGEHALEWQAGSLSSGVYYYRVSFGKQSVVKKAIILD